MKIGDPVYGPVQTLRHSLHQGKLKQEYPDHTEVRRSWFNIASAEKAEDWKQERIEILFDALKNDYERIEILESIIIGSTNGLESLDHVISVVRVVLEKHPECLSMLSLNNLSFIESLQ